MKRLLFVLLLLFSQFSTFSQSLSKQQVVRDLDHYHKVLHQVHYNPYQFVTRKAYQRRLEQIKADLPDSLNTYAMIRLLHSLTAMMEDSHSMPALQQPLFRSEMKEETYFSDKLGYIGGKLFVEESSSGIPVGAELLEVNGKPVKQLVKSFRGYVGGLEQYKKEMTARLFPHFLFLNEFKPPFRVSYRVQDGVRKEATVAGISFIDMIILNMPGLVKPNSFAIHQDRVGYINFRNMYGNWEDFSKLLDSAFVTFEKRGIKTLAVDLRENSGGNSVLGDLLFSYLTSEPYELQGKRYWKISQQMKDQIRSSGQQEHPYLDQPNGSIWERGSCTPAESPFSNDRKFSGDVYFMTGPFTFSSGNMVADGAKTYNIGKIIGEPTGESANDFGEVISISLPESGIVMNLTTAMDIGAECQTGTYSPVLPDTYIPTTAKDIIENRDPVLEWLLENTNP